MRIAVMGSGGIGGYVGARLAEAGEDVVFIARGKHLEAMRASGLRVKSPFGDLALPQVSATDNPAGLGAVDIVIFTVKLYDSDRAAETIAPLVGAGTRVVSLQNGIDSVATLSRHFAKSRVVGGCTYISGYIESPGVILHAGNENIEMGGAGDSVSEAFAASCNAAKGLRVRIVGNIDAILWEKFITLAAFSGGTTLMRSGIGPILADPEGRVFMEQLLDEGLCVAAALGHHMDGAYRARVAERWTEALPPETMSSMANDLIRGHPLELNWLSGRMHALGTELGVPTPAHTAAYRALHLFAAGSGNG
jgi:2-dehydropantoate 2-reductase